MAVETRLAVRLPEGAGIELRSAGLASRAVAAAIDLAIAMPIIFALTAGPLKGHSAADWWRSSAGAVTVLGIVVVFPLACELVTGGGSPGKAMLRLHVVSADGGVLRGRALLVRNLLRVVDALPFPYGVGLASAIVTSRAQRLGDLAAGTAVVQRPTVDRGVLVPTQARALAWATAHGVAVDPRVWDVAGLDDNEFRAVRRFLERRDQLPMDVRNWTAAELARRVQPKVVGAPTGLPAEVLLEGVVVGRA